MSNIRYFGQWLNTRDDLWFYALLAVYSHLIFNSWCSLVMTDSRSDETLHPVSEAAYGYFCCYTHWCGCCWWYKCQLIVTRCSWLYVYIVRLLSTHLLTTLCQLDFTCSMHRKLWNNYKQSQNLWELLLNAILLIEILIEKFALLLNKILWKCVGDLLFLQRIEIIKQIPNKQ